MNKADEARRARVAALGDLDLLRTLVTRTGKMDEEISEFEYTALCDMIKRVRAGAALTRKQRGWAAEIALRIIPYSAKDVPVGRAVETPAVLRHLPLKPPGRP